VPPAPLVVHAPEIRRLLDPAACIAAVERAFTDYAQGRAELPGVIHLDVPPVGGEIHVKAGYVHGGRWWAVKIASGFPGNAALGLPPNGGMVLAFAARTGEPAAILLDDGYITDLRTAAAGAVAARHLARQSIDVVAVVGTGAQARLQPRLLAQVRAFREVRVWGRRREGAELCAAELGEGALPSGARARAVSSVREAVEGADIVFTVTASRTPLVRAEWLAAGSLVVAVGADGADKQELEVGVLAGADRVVADSLPQCRRIGEIHHAVEAGVLDESRVTELGYVTAGLTPGRERDHERIVCDLTGVGVQDVAAAGVVLERLEVTPRAAASR
jgi:ornithine cyclodeaminase